MDTHCWLLLHREGLHALRSCNYRFYVIKCLAFMQSPCVGHGLCRSEVCCSIYTLQQNPFTRVFKIASGIERCLITALHKTDKYMYTSQFSSTHQTHTNAEVSTRIQMSHSAVSPSPLVTAAMSSSAPSSLRLPPGRTWCQQHTQSSEALKCILCPTTCRHTSVLLHWPEASSTSWKDMSACPFFFSVYSSSTFWTKVQTRHSTWKSSPLVWAEGRQLLHGSPARGLSFWAPAQIGSRVTRCFGCAFYVLWQASIDQQLWKAVCFRRSDIRPLASTRSVAAVSRVEGLWLHLGIQRAWV